MAKFKKGDAVALKQDHRPCGQRRMYLKGDCFTVLEDSIVPYLRGDDGKIVAMSEDVLERIP